MSTLISSTTIPTVTILTATTATTPSNTISSSSNSDASKRYSLVKWLENSQFDVNNEYFCRLTSVPHSNIIDFDSDDLKAGMEISVFRNGEIWRAQIIIPKTASNTIDLPSSSQRISKIRTKALAMGKANDSGDDTIVMLTNTSLGGNGNPGQLNCLDGNNNKTFADLNDFEDVTALFGSANVTNNGTSPLQQSHVAANQMANNSVNMNINGGLSSTGLTSAKMNTTIVTPGGANKEWQFLQTAINEAGLSDLYQTYSNDITSPNGVSNNANLKPHIYTNTSPTMNNSTANMSGHHFRVTVNDMNIETILQMQCELLDQQKELKLIETDTLEQLRLLHTNISRLAKKFDSFEAIVASKKETSSHSSPSKHQHLQQQQQQQQAYTLTGTNLIKIKDECYQQDTQNGLNNSNFSPAPARPRSSRNTRSRSKQQTVYSSASSLAESIAATVASVFNDNSIT